MLVTPHSSSESSIHPTAVIEAGAKLGSRVRVGPYCMVGADVTLEDDVRLDSHVVVRGCTRIGARTRVWPYASIGTAPQDLKYRGEPTFLEIGTDNMLREYCNLSVGTEGGGNVTRVGSHNLLMVGVHIAHDCLVGDHTILANSVSLAGHVEVDHRAVIGGHSAIHQFVKIGSCAMVGGGSILVQDTPPYVTVQGNHARAAGLNVVGLKRAGYSVEQLREIKQYYKWTYQSELRLEQAVQEILRTAQFLDLAKPFVDFLARSTRGICR
ncbi:MAG: acyl-ACP--UDP-N-acetylglucosamine O-acyltransferase [Zetaproteobacteria bacterium]|nr:acyl-ACP--UDP-N-acetylglucosamine O-acyltransferase [Zetaproteobacteria bacterium]